VVILEFYGVHNFDLSLFMDFSNPCIVNVFSVAVLKEHTHTDGDQLMNPV
jgi:hypothetical protein